jgi:hypothetical protein
MFWLAAEAFFQELAHKEVEVVDIIPRVRKSPLYVEQSQCHELNAQISDRRSLPELPSRIGPNDLLSPMSDLRGNGTISTDSNLIEKSFVLSVDYFGYLDMITFVPKFCIAHVFRLLVANPVVKRERGGLSPKKGLIGASASPCCSGIATGLLLP